MVSERLRTMIAEDEEAALEAKERQPRLITNKTVAQALLNVIKRDAKVGDLVELELDPKTMRYSVGINGKWVHVAHWNDPGTFDPEQVRVLVAKGMAKMVK